MVVILSGAKDLGVGAAPTPRSFAPLRMTRPFNAFANCSRQPRLDTKGLARGAPNAE
jgi:hypothetical protein